MTEKEEILDLCVAELGEWIRDNPTRYLRLADRILLAGFHKQQDARSQRLQATIKTVHDRMARITFLNMTAGQWVDIICDLKTALIEDAGDAK